MGLRVSLHSSNPEALMSALGHKRTSELICVMSALPPKADMDQHEFDVRYVPISDIGEAIRSPYQHLLR